VAAELALGELVQLDVQGFPLMRQWHLVYPLGKRLSPAALAFKAWLRQAASALAEASA